MGCSSSGIQNTQPRPHHVYMHECNPEIVVYTADFARPAPFPILLPPSASTHLSEASAFSHPSTEYQIPPSRADTLEVRKENIYSAHHLYVGEFGQSCRPLGCETRLCGQLEIGWKGMLCFWLEVPLSL
jgi:hypothetical protein